MPGGEQARQPKLIEISDGELIAAINLTGAYLEQLQVHGDDLLLPRQEITESDQSKDRGGAFPCSPYFGPGVGLGLKEQHGFRDEAWTRVVDESRPDRLVMMLGPDDERPDPYQGLWQKLTYTIDAGFGYSPSLSVELQLANQGDQEFRAFPGLHPYFPVSSGASPQFRFLTSEHEQDTMVRTRLRSRLPSAELVDDQTVETTFMSNGRQVTIASRDLVRAVVWSGSPNKYVCVEPTSAGFYGSQEKMPTLLPGATRLYRATIAWKPGAGMAE